MIVAANAVAVLLHPLLLLLLSVNMSDREKSAMGQITLVFKEKISMETSLKNHPMGKRIRLGCFYGRPIGCVWVSGGTIIDSRNSLIELTLHEWKMTAGIIALS